MGNHYFSQLRVVHENLVHHQSNNLLITIGYHFPCFFYYIRRRKYKNSVCMKQVWQQTYTQSEAYSYIRLKAEKCTRRTKLMGVDITSRIGYKLLSNWTKRCGHDLNVYSTHFLNLNLGVFIWLAISFLGSNIMRSWVSL